ncbi:hypothetical protein [Streptomyces sp. SID13031]|uniref:hypothetical protein n=1 Tax=Streptomyces sp. SID13031 TaxID=2706046 RepID=UPI0013CD9EBC|nr:hypothetical protein [Streptomyces sp. SID13031]NEA32306.1 hypothetical protein [Streptomyces sp. SID13031]
MVNITMKPNGVSVALPCAHVQGAALSRLHVETVVVLADVFTQIKGGAVGGTKYGGQGSRAWSPPV